MNAKKVGYRRYGVHVIALMAICGMALAMSARPAAARVNVFVGATIGIPLSVAPVYAAPAYYPPPPAVYYAPPPVYVDYGPRWRGPHHKHYWKRHPRSCYRCGGYCR